MKICLLTRRFALETGGIGRVSIELRDRLRALGHEVYTVSTTEEDLVHYFKYSFWSIRSKIPKGYDIYHAITPMESIWLPKEKSVATILDIIPITHPERHGARMGGSRLKYTIGKACFTIGCKRAAQCKRVACISNHVRQEFIEHFKVSEEKISTIKLGIREDLEPKPKPDDVFRLGYLGQLDRRKRLDVLIRALKASKIDGELVLAGKGFNELELKAMASGDSRIKFLGFVPDNRLTDFYNSLDYFIFPTWIDAYGLPPVEAMACKRPVIVLKDAIMPEEVKSRCIATGNLGGLLKALDGIKTSAQFLESNYQFAKEHSWDKCVERYLELYKEVTE